MIGIMSAMPEETSGIENIMTNVKRIDLADRTYITGLLNSIPVVLTFSRWGKVAAATTATTLMHEFKITQLIFTGVAGAVSKNLKVGDIVIANRLFQHDMNAYPLFPRHEIPLTGKTFYYANETLTRCAIKAVSSFYHEIHAHITSQVLKTFQISKPKYKVGTIASGDQFIGSKEQSQAITNSVSDTLAVEMEGAAVAQVCEDHQIPFTIIRTISDTADHSAHIDFGNFIQQIASLYSVCILNNLIGYNSEFVLKEACNKAAI